MLLLRSGFALSRRSSHHLVPEKRKPGRPKKSVTPPPPPPRPIPPTKRPLKPPSNEPSSSALEHGHHALEGLALRNHEAVLLDLAQRADSKWKTGSDPSVDLPPVSEWTMHFPLRATVRERVCIQNAATADAVAEAFVPGGSEGKVIIEAFPGPGTLTRSLLMLPKDRIRKLIILEDHEPFIKYLLPLARHDPRVHFLPMDPYAWETYKAIEEQGLFDNIVPTPWSEVHSQIHFISHLPNSVMGEQLVAQLFRGIPERSWLFKWGRVPLSFLLNKWVLDRIAAGPSKAANARCKLGIIAQATSHLSEALPYFMLQPYNDNFYPKTVSRGPVNVIPDVRRRGSPFAAMNIVPREHQIIKSGMLEKWDYCLRRLFVLKAHPISNAIGHLAFGAESLITALTSPALPPSHRVDMKKPVRELTVADWANILRAFDNWPFAPEDLLITDSFNKDPRKE